MPKPVSEVGEDDVVQLVIQGPLFPDVVQYLVARGLSVFPIPSEPDDLDTFVVGIGEELWRSLDA